MKRYFSNIFAILVSGALISSTLFFTAFGGFNAEQLEQLPVESTSSAKSGNYENVDKLSVSKINVNKIFGKFTSGKANNDQQNQNAASEPSSSRTTTIVVSNNTTTATSETTKKTSSATTTATAKAPVDETKNIDYIKDPDYKSKYYIVVYTGSQSAVVYGKDDSGAYNVKVKAFTVSTGRIGSTPTRKGVYRIRAKYRWRRLMGDCWGQYSSSISSSYLFHSVPYDKQSPDSLYNASYNNLGKAVSHGCIRMCVRDCKWIYDNCPIGTQVNVVWTSGPAGASVPKRKSGAKYSGWDPSDQWSKGNPYFSDSHKTSTTTTITTTTSTDTTTASSATQSSQSSKTSAVSQTAASTAITTTTTTAASTQPPQESIDDFDGIPVG